MGTVNLSIIYAKVNSYVCHRGMGMQEYHYGSWVFEAIQVQNEI